MIVDTKPFIVVDIDGTLADLSHRLHFIKEKPKKWNRFEDECLNDALHEDIASLVRQLHYIVGYDVVLCSGRSDHYRDKTVEWLNKNLIPYQALYMRKHGDYRSDDIVKEEILDNFILVNHGTPFFVLDDRDRVVNKWRERGIRCLQVANGNF